MIDQTQIMTEDRKKGSLAKLMYGGRGKARDGKQSRAERETERRHNND